MKNNMEPNNTNKRPLVDIVAEILEIQDYTDEERKEAIDKTTAMLAEAALIRSLEVADATVQEAFAKLIEENPTDDRLQEFIQESLPQFNEKLGEEIATLQGAAQ